MTPFDHFALCLIFGYVLGKVIVAYLELRK